MQQFRLQVKTQLESLTDVLSWFEQIIVVLLSHQLISEKWGWQYKLALAEAFTNTVRYAHQHLPLTTPIDLEVNLFTHFVEIRIWDRGQPFDLRKKLESLPEIKQNPLDKESDRGLFFMKELTDNLQYLNLGNQYNCLIMQKKIDCLD